MPKFAVRLTREATYTEYATCEIIAATEELAIARAKEMAHLNDPAWLPEDWESDAPPKITEARVDEDAEGWPRELPR